MANALVITDAGLDRMIRPDQSGTDVVRISSCRFGSGKWNPTKAATALKTPFSWTLGTVSGGAVAGNQIHIEVTDGSERSYTAYEVGLYDSSGILIAVASQSSPIINKAASSTAMVTFDIALENLDAESITFGDTTYVNPSATETKEGVAEIATQAETEAGTDDHRFVTPKKLAAWIAGKLAPYLRTSLLLDKTWPVGSVYMSVSATSPATLFGGTWTRLQDCFLYAGTGTGDYAPGKTGGSKAVTLAAANMPKHSHTVTSADAGAKAAATITSTSDGKHSHAVTTSDAGAKAASTVASTSAGGHTPGGKITGGKHTHAATVANAGGHTPAGTISGGSHKHTATTESAGAHVHGAMGEMYKKDSKYEDYAHNGFYDKSNNHHGLDSGDNDNSLWNTTKNGAHTHALTTANATPSMTFKGTAVSAHKHTVTNAEVTPSMTFTGTAVAAHSHNVTVPAIAAHSHAATCAEQAAHSHKVTVPAIPAHSHAMTCGTAGSGTAVNIMPPFLAIYMWRRTA